MTIDAKTQLKVALGTMTFGKEGTNMARVHDLAECAAMLDVFQAHGHNELDSARIYGDGSCEEYLGELDWASRGLVMGTKLHPWSLGVLPLYTHSPEGIRAGFLDSMKALKTETVDLWYLHAPDRSIPYEDTLREVNKLYQEGRFKRFGISMYAAWEVAQISEICIRNNWVRPTVYQGVYNALQRNIEPELLPCLRKYGISFYLWGPLAGGMLTDAYGRESETEKGGRYDPNTIQGSRFRQRYWNEKYFGALDVIRPVAKKLGITTSEAALRWVEHHSLLKRERGDTILVGASSAEQLETNLSALDKGPLPEEMVQALDEGWAMVKPIAEPYFS